MITKELITLLAYLNNLKLGKNSALYTNIRKILHFRFECQKLCYCKKQNVSL